MQYKAVKGMEDILPEDSFIWRSLEERIRGYLDLYGFSEIRTPIVEETILFVRGIGSSTDIVNKQMYTFTDKKGRSLTLRPEGTAPVVRAYIEHSMDKKNPVDKFYYIGPMFRSEKPQKGRTRQFHQVGVEIIGVSSYYADIELLLQLDGLLKKIGLDEFTIRLNSLGCEKDKQVFCDELQEYFQDKKRMLCAECRERFRKNILRILDCKNETCRKITARAPDIGRRLCPSCKEHFENVYDVLKNFGLSILIDRKLVRGLDYYTGVIFEVIHPALGSQDAIAAGGRYDNLVGDFGGPEVGAAGYAIGMERVIIALKRKDLSSCYKTTKKLLFIATLGRNAKVEGYNICKKVRDELNIPVYMDVRDSSLKSQMRLADKLGAFFVIIIGEEELKKSGVVFRDMFAKKQSLIHKASIIEEIRRKIEMATVKEGSD